MPEWEGVGNDKSLKTEERQGKGSCYIEVKIQMKYLPKAPFCCGVLALWLIFQKRGNRNRISGKCSWEVVVKKVKRKKSNKTFPYPTRSMCVGVWLGRREPVIWVLSKGSRSFLNSSKQPLPALVGTWQIWDLGFWQRQEHQEFRKGGGNLSSFWEREDEKGWISWDGCQGRDWWRTEKGGELAACEKQEGHQSSGGTRAGRIQSFSGHWEEQSYPQQCLWTWAGIRLSEQPLE